VHVPAALSLHDLTAGKHSGKRLIHVVPAQGRIRDVKRRGRLARAKESGTSNAFVKTPYHEPPPVRPRPRPYLLMQS
jgi:hypothetical protein